MASAHSHSVRYKHQALLVQLQQYIRMPDGIAQSSQLLACLIVPVTCTLGMRVSELGGVAAQFAMMMLAKSP